MSNIHKDALEYMFGKIADDVWLRMLSNRFNPPSMLDEWTKWQPIETAPRDGTFFIARVSNGIDEPRVCPMILDGRHNDTVINIADGNQWSATHWMPLPTPPTDW